MQVSPAIQEILKRIADPGLLERVSFTFENASSTAASLRSLDFKPFEERRYERGSPELWNELEPLISHVLQQMAQYLGLLRELFPPRADRVDASSSDANFDDLEFDIEGARAAPEAKNKHDEPRLPIELVHDLIDSYEPMLASEMERQIERLKSPNIRSEQWTLLGELADFRDRCIGALHSMVAAICGVFQKGARPEDLFPDARDTLERLVALRRALADLELDIDFYNRTIIKAENDELPTLVEMLQGKVIEFMAHPAFQFLRAPQKQTVRETAVLLGQLATDEKFRPALARQTVEGFAKFLESMRTISLQEVLIDQDKISASEGRDFLERAIGYIRSDFDQALFQVMNAVRRLGQLYGVDAEVDRAYQNLPDMESNLTTPQALAEMIDELRVLFSRFR